MRSGPARLKPGPANLSPSLSTLEEPLPERIVPMLARLSTLPQPDAAFAYEFKWDGVRAIGYISQGQLRLQSRNLLDLTHQYPELQPLGRQLRGQRLVLDGEIIALNAQGVPSFSALQGRLGVSNEAMARQRMQRIPIIYMLFDLLYLDGVSLMRQPYVERRRLLQALQLAGASWLTPAYHIGAGAAMLESSRQQKLEGIVAKRLDSTYQPGLRTGAWLKIKNHQRQEFVIGGWLPGEGARQGKIGSLLLGTYDLSPEKATASGTSQNLIYVGKAGTGYTDKMLQELGQLLAPIHTAHNPFAPSRLLPRRPMFVQPRYVGEFEFTEWTHQNILRHPSFKGLRGDKDPHAIVRESTAGGS